MTAFSSFGQVKEARTKKVAYVDEHRILSIKAKTPTTGHVAGLYRKSDGFWYERWADGSEHPVVGAGRPAFPLWEASTYYDVGDYVRKDTAQNQILIRNVAGMSGVVYDAMEATKWDTLPPLQILMTTAAPSGNFHYQFAVDTVGVDTLYINNGGVSWDRFEAGSGGGGPADGNGIYTGSGTVTGRVDVSMTQNDTVAFERDIYIHGLRVGGGFNAVASNAVLGVNAGGDTVHTEGSVLIGENAGASLLNADRDMVLIGREAGMNTQNARFSTAVGYWALRANTDGQDHTAVGYLALSSNTTGEFNTAVGYNALGSTTTGSENVAYGWGALGTMPVSSTNMAVGYQAMQLATAGTRNTALGQEVLHASSGSGNTGIGFRSLNAVGAGANNFGGGYFSGRFLTTGNNNTLVGYNTASTLTTGSNNTIVGANVNVPASNTDNNIIFGSGNGTIKAQNNQTKWILEDQLQLNEYGSGTFTGANAYILGEDASGNVLEMDATAVENFLGGGNGIFSSGNDGSNVPTAFDFGLTDYLNIDNNLMRFDGTNSEIGIGISDPLAKTHIRGNGTTGTAFRVDASDNTNLFQVDENGRVGVGGGAVARFQITENTSYLRFQESTAINGFVIGDNEQNWAMATQVSGASKNPTGSYLFFEHSTGRFGMNTRPPAGAFHLRSKGNTQSTRALFVEDSGNVDLFELYDNGNVFFNKGQVSINYPGWDAQLHVRGSGATSSTYSARFQNSSDDLLFRVRDDGQIQLNQYGSTGFTGTVAKLIGVDASGNALNVDPTTYSNQENIYNTSGTLDANRTLWGSVGTYSLTIDSTNFAVMRSRAASGGANSYFTTSKIASSYTEGNHINQGDASEFTRLRLSYSQGVDVNLGDNTSSKFLITKTEGGSVGTWSFEDGTASETLSNGSAVASFNRNTTSISASVASGAVSSGFTVNTTHVVFDDFIKLTPMATPSSPTAGMVYYDSTTNKLRCYDGTSWNDLF